MDTNLIAPQRVFDLPDARGLWPGFRIAFLEPRPFTVRWIDSLGQPMHHEVTGQYVFSVVADASGALSWKGSCNRKARRFGNHDIEKSIKGIASKVYDVPEESLRIEAGVYCDVSHGEKTLLSQYGSDEIETLNHAKEELAARLAAKKEIGPRCDYR